MMTLTVGAARVTSEKVNIISQHNHVAVFKYVRSVICPDTV